jgi:hypothetical protein
MARLRIALCFALLASAILAASASAATYGSRPLNISAPSPSVAPNGGSGQPSVSGDNRKARLIAFYSDASNLTSGDNNGRRDIFVWHRPRSNSFRSIGHIGAGKLSRASVSSRGVQSNGNSENPSIDGSMNNSPHCVAFQSQATNLSSADATPDWDIYVRDLRRHKTRLVSKGAPADAINPSINGRCSAVLFESAGRIYKGSVRGRAARAIASGTQPDYSLDGQSKVWVSGGQVVFRHPGRNRTLGAGSNPEVSDRSGKDGWGIGYQSGGSAMLGIVRNNGKHSTLTVTGGGVIGGVSVYAATRGIIVYSRGGALYYLNRHTGNSDDLAYANSNITEMSASARSTVVAFSSNGGSDFVDNGRGVKSVYVKYLPH